MSGKILFDPNVIHADMLKRYGQVARFTFINKEYDCYYMNG